MEAKRGALRFDFRKILSYAALDNPCRTLEDLRMVQSALCQRCGAPVAPGSVACTFCGVAFTGGAGGQDAMGEDRGTPECDDATCRGLVVGDGSTWHAVATAADRDPGDQRVMHMFTHSG